MVEEAGSQNGTVLNGARVRRRKGLSTGDVLRLGKYECIFYADETSTLHNNEMVEDLPLYRPVLKNSVNDTTTFLISAAEAKRRIERERLLESASLVARDGDGSWHLGEQLRVIGRGQEIPATGWTVWGQVACVSWDGAAHTIERRAFWVQLRVNGEKVNKIKRIREGDEIQIGDSLYLYERVEPPPPAPAHGSPERLTSGPRP